tara:strand:+ start:2483 stop:4042 length:1560 start_codon:yes stop_codon:yes gene_type:complete
MYVDNTEKHIRHLSLCSGYEGIGIGLRRVLPNVREIAHVEIEAFAAANLVAKMEAGLLDPCPVFTNLKEFPFRKFRGQVDILTGGFPCQPFSNAGAHKSTEDPRHLFPFILEGIKECRPRFVFLENVEGIISSKTGDGESVLQYVLRSLEEVGYSATAGLFSASEVGAPHQRKRVFIMGHSNSDESSALRSYVEEMLGLQEEAGQDECAPVSGGTGYEVANPDLKGLEGSLLSGEPSQEGTTTATGCSSGDMANTNDTGLEGRGHPASVEDNCEQADITTAFGLPWPARPGEVQFEWEEPRVVGNSNSQPSRKATGTQQPTEGATIPSPQGVVGNPKHNGQSAPKVRGSTETTSTDSPKGAEEAGESAGTSRPKGSGDIQGGEQAMADSESVRCRGREDQDSGDRQGVQEPEGEERPVVRGEAAGCGGDTRSELGNTTDERPQKWRPEEVGRREEDKEPQRPTVSYEREAQPELGGTPNGCPPAVDTTANRVDRLRMLGNGVVPATAERAFRILTSRLL